MKKMIPLLALSILLGAACGDDDTVTADGSDGGLSVQGEWRLVAGPVPDAAIGATTLRIDADGTVAGTTACNSYGTESPAIDGDRWVATDIFVTEMGCEPDRMEAESAYVDALATMTDVAVSATGLELSSADASGVLIFESVVPPPDSELIGTTWILESLIVGDAVSSTMGGAEDATLVLAADGSVTGTDGGCGELRGSYEIDGASIHWSVALDPGTGCEPVFAAQSAHIEQVLGSDTTFEIEGPALALLTADGIGLDYRDRS
jgi:heat shock protein HslJ